MKTVVAFTNNRVQILCGEGSRERISITKAVDVAFEINCVINGVITDAEAFTAGIKKIWAEESLPKAGIILSLDGNNIKSKKTSIPKLNAAKTGDIVAREFQEIEVLSDPLFSYVTVAETQGKREMIAFGAEQEFIDTLLKLFAAADIKVAMICSARGGMIRLLGYLDFAAGKNCILQSIDGETLTTVLLEQGQFVNVSSTRVFSEHGSQPFGTEVARGVNQLLQFQRSERSENIATEVYMAGFSREDTAVSTTQIEGLGLAVRDFSDGGRLLLSMPVTGTIILHAGALALGKQEGNLVTAYQLHKKDVRKRDKILLKILPILVVVAVLTTVSSMMIIENNGKQRTLDTLTAYIQDPANIAAQGEYNEKIQEAALLNSQIRLTEELKAALESYPLATSALNNLISRSGSGIVEVNITSYAASSGALGFTATGKSAEKLNEFVKALTDTGVFYDVSYSGYTGGLVGDYNVNVTCTLSHEAGR